MRTIEENRAYHKKWRDTHREQYNAKKRAWRLANPEKVMGQRKRYHLEQMGKNTEWKKNNRELYLEQKKRHHTRHRQACLEHYGRVCACPGCNEAHEEFLAIDHIAGGGNKHRKEIGSKAGNQFYVWIIKNNFPSLFRTLCHNCNHSRGLYGYCPHEREASKSVEVLQVEDAGAVL